MAIFAVTAAYGRIIRTAFSRIRAFFILTTEFERACIILPPEYYLGMGQPLALIPDIGKTVSNLSNIKSTRGEVGVTGIIVLDGWGGFIIDYSLLII